MTFRYVECSQHEAPPSKRRTAVSQWGGGAVVTALMVIYAAASYCEPLTAGGLVDKSTDRPGLFTHPEQLERTGGINVWRRPAHTRPVAGTAAALWQSKRVETKDAILDENIDAVDGSTTFTVEVEIDQIYWSAPNEPITATRADSPVIPQKQSHPFFPHHH